MSFSPLNIIKGAQFTQTWREFLARIGCQTVEKETSGFSPTGQFVFPDTTFRIEQGDQSYGYIFDVAACEDITAGMVADHGYLAIGGSMGGSTLLMNVTPDRYGWCRWLAPGWDHVVDNDFDLIVTGLIGPPWEIIEDMIEYDNDYNDDLRFPRWK
jgi:hypothetical protein